MFCETWKAQALGLLGKRRKETGALALDAWEQASPPPASILTPKLHPPHPLQNIHLFASRSFLMTWGVLPLDGGIGRGCPEGHGHMLI